MRAIIFTGLVACALSGCAAPSTPPVPATPAQTAPSGGGTLPERATCGAKSYQHVLYFKIEGKPYNAGARGCVGFEANAPVARYEDSYDRGRAADVEIAIDGQTVALDRFDYPPRGASFDLDAQVSFRGVDLTRNCFASGTFAWIGEYTVRGTLAPIGKARCT